MYPKAFSKLIKNMSSLPSVGPKMAERLVLFLFKQDPEKLAEFAENLLEIKNLKICSRCFNIAEGELCEFCKDPKRDQHSICVVEEPLDIISIERTRSYAGLYHVLGGVIQVGNAGEELKINELLTRVENEKITEVILATNPTTEGDATALYLKRKLQSLHNIETNPVESAEGGLPRTEFNRVHPVESVEDGLSRTEFNRVKITRLGRGLSTGADLEYADEITLSSALTNRTELL